MADIFVVVVLLTPEEEQQLRSPEFRSTVRVYAGHLQRIFATMGTLSDTGVKCDRDSHSEVTVQEIAPSRRTRGRETETFSWHDAPFGMDAPPNRPEPLPPTAETKFLDQWMDREPTPLLILAEFGCGKSVFLESAALKLAGRLLDEKFYADGERPPGVPLPVRLRAWNWHQNEQFEKFLYRSQSLFPGNPTEGNFFLKELRLLLKAGLLVPLFDGLEELPGDYDVRVGTNPRERALSEIHALAKMPDAPCRIIVSSRPGYGADHHPMFAETNRIELKAFSELECLAYVNRRFPDGDAAGAFESAQSKIGATLSKPLFLAAWCDRFLDGNPPEIVSDLMQAFVTQIFEPKRIQRWLSLPTAQNSRFENKALDPADLQELIPAFGALFFVFAHSSFNKPLLRGHVQSCFRKLLPDHLRGELDWVMFLASQAGLLQPVGKSEWLAIKVPITEYFAGVYLAYLANKNEESRRSFISLFRRWVWLPEMHEALFFAFVQFRSTSMSESSFADDLVQWLLQISRCCPLYGRHSGTQAASTATIGIVAQDDLLHPLAVLASRLTTNIKMTVPALVQARIRADIHHGSANIPILGRIQSNAVEPFIRAYIKDWAHRTPTNEYGLTTMLVQALSRMPVQAVLAFLDEALEATTEDSSELHLVPEQVFSDAAHHAIKYCIPNTHWHNRLKDATGDAALELAMVSLLGGPLPEDQVEHCITLLLMAIEGADEKCAEKYARYIARAAEDLPEACAENCIMLLLRAVENATSGVVKALARAIGRAAQKLPNARVEPCIGILLLAIKKGAYDVAKSLARAVGEATQRLSDTRTEHYIVSLWLPTIKNSARNIDFNIYHTVNRLPETAAERCITLLLSEVRETTGEVAEELTSAIRGAIGRLPPVRAEHCITLLLLTIKEATGRVATALALAVGEAAERLPDTRAEHCITLWLPAIKEATGDVAEALARAIGKVAGRVPHTRAEPCITFWLTAIKEATGDVAVALAWAVQNAADRLPNAQAKRYIVLLLDEVREASDDVAHALASAVRQALNRLPDEQLESCIMLFLAAVREATGLVAETFAWCVFAASLRLPETKVEDCIVLVMQAIKEAGDHNGFLRETLYNAVGRLPPVHAYSTFQYVRSFTSGNDQKLTTLALELMEQIVDNSPLPDALKFAQEIMNEREHARAMQVVSRHPALAARLIGFDPSTLTPVYEFLWRTNDRLLLDDDDLSHASENIRTLGAFRLDARRQYELLRETLTATNDGQANHLPPWSAADDAIKESAAETWNRAARKLEIAWPEDAAKCKPHYLLLKIIGDSGVLISCWHALQAPPKLHERQREPFATRTDLQGLEFISIKTGEILSLTLAAAMTAIEQKNLPPKHKLAMKRAVRRWFGECRSTDKADAVLKLMETGRSPLPSNITGFKKDGKHRLVERGPFEQLLKDDKIMDLIILRCQMGGAKRAIDPEDAFEDQSEDKVPVCHKCGRIEELNKKSGPKGRVNSPCRSSTCKEPLSAANIDPRPGKVFLCTVASCRAIYSPLQREWDNALRQNGRCAACQGKNKLKLVDFQSLPNL